MADPLVQFAEEALERLELVKILRGHANLAAVALEDEAAVSAPHSGTFTVCVTVAVRPVEVVALKVTGTVPTAVNFP
jgi:hypothetical protein